MKHEVAKDSKVGSQSISQSIAILVISIWKYPVNSESLDVVFQDCEVQGYQASSQTTTTGPSVS